LIDHGNGFGPDPTTSEFAIELNGQPIPEKCQRHLETLIANEKGSRLPTVLPDATVSALFARAQLFVQDSVLSI
jgi:hypothetical protein